MWHLEQSCWGLEVSWGLQPFAGLASLWQCHASPSFLKLLLGKIPGFSEPVFSSSGIY